MYTQPLQTLLSTAMQPLTLLLAMTMCHTVFAVPVASSEVKPDTSYTLYTSDTPHLPYTQYTTDTPSYGSEEATNAEDDTHTNTDDEDTERNTNTRDEGPENDNEIESETTEETNVAESDVSPETNIQVARSSPVERVLDTSMDSEKDVQRPTISTIAVEATSAPPSLEKHTTNNSEIYIDKTKQFQRLLEQVRNRPEKTAADIDIEWMDIQDYTKEQIDQLRLAALPRANAKDLFCLDFRPNFHASNSENPDFDQEAAYRIMKALMYAGSYLAVTMVTGTSYNAKFLKVMARAQRENTRYLENVKVHSSLSLLDCGEIPITRDVVLPDSHFYFLGRTPWTSHNHVEWSILNKDSQDETCFLDSAKDTSRKCRFSLSIIREEGTDVKVGIFYSLVKYPHPTEHDQTVLKIQDAEVSRKDGEDCLGSAKYSGMSRAATLNVHIPECNDHKTTRM